MLIIVQYMKITVIFTQWWSLNAVIIINISFLSKPSSVFHMCLHRIVFHSMFFNTYT